VVDSVCLSARGGGQRRCYLCLAHLHGSPRLARGTLRLCRRHALRHLQSSPRFFSHLRLGDGPSARRVVFCDPLGDCRLRHGLSPRSFPPPSASCLTSRRNELRWLSRSLLATTWRCCSGDGILTPTSTPFPSCHLPSMSLASSSSSPYTSCRVWPRSRPRRPQYRPPTPSRWQRRIRPCIRHPPLPSLYIENSLTLIASLIPKLISSVPFFSSRARDRCPKSRKG
jgi:hypothetical protein